MSDNSKKQRVKASDYNERVSRRGRIFVQRARTHARREAATKDGEATANESTNRSSRRLMISRERERARERPICLTYTPFYTIYPYLREYTFGCFFICFCYSRWRKLVVGSQYNDRNRSLYSLVTDKSMLTSVCNFPSAGTQLTLYFQNVL